MENYNDGSDAAYALQRVEDVCNSCDAVASKMENALTLVNSAACTIQDTVQIIANVKYDMAKLDHDLDMFIAESNTRLEAFKAFLPLLEKQLTKASDRIDVYADKVLTNAMNPDDPYSVQKHSEAMNLLEMYNDHFNKLLMKLII